MAYDENYATPNFFRDLKWLFKPFVRAIIRAASLKPGSRVLDAGCGQGLFTALFAEAGMDALGVDLSEVGIRSANEHFAATGARFEVGDILRLPYARTFDLVFSRSLSLYNTQDFASNPHVSQQLARYVANGGMFVFDYYTRLAPAKQTSSASWRYHSLDDGKKHFSCFHDSQCFFSTRMECGLLREWSFSAPISLASSALSRMFGVGGELVAFVPAQPAQARRAEA